MKKKFLLWDTLKQRFFIIFKPRYITSENKFFCKMILPHESGSQEDRFYEKIEVKNLVVLSL